MLPLVRPGRERLLAPLALLLLLVSSALATDFVPWRPPLANGIQAPQRLIRDGRGGLYAYFQPVDISGGVYAGFLSRLRESNSTLDISFSFGLPHNSVGAVAVLPDGRLYVAYGTGDSFRVARVSSTGVPDPTFRSPLFQRGIRFIVLQPDGKLLVSVTDGNVTNPPATALPLEHATYRLNTDGSLDPTFTKAVATGPSAIFIAPPIVLSSGKIIISGIFSAINGVSRTNIARLEPNGALDLTWLGLQGVNPVFSGQVRGTYEQADGSVVAVGDFRTPDPVTGQLIAVDQALGAVRFTPSGQLDPTYGRPRIRQELGIVNGLRPRYVLPRDGGGCVLVSDRLVALTANGAVDTSFTTVAFGAEAFWVERGNDGRYYVPDGLSVGGQSVSGMAVFNANGSFAGSFGPGNYGTASFPTQAARLGDGDLVVAGGFTRFIGGTVPGAVRVGPSGEPSGSPIPAVAELVPSNVQVDLGSVASGPDGTFYALTGGFNPSNQYVTALGRFLPSGTRDGSWSTSLTTAELNGFTSLFPTSQGGVFLVGGGSFQAVVSNAVRILRKLAPNGAPDGGFALDPTLLDSYAALTRYPNNQLQTITLGTLLPLDIDSQGRILVLQVKLDGATSLVRLAPDGSRDPSFNAPSFGRTTAAASFPVVFDPVTNTNVQPGEGARYFGPTLVTAAASLPDGGVVVTGRFRTVGGFPQPGVARLNADGSLRLGFPRGLGPELRVDPAGLPSVNAVASDTQGRIVLAGRFDTYDGVAAPGLVRLRPDGTVDPTDNPGVSVPIGGSSNVGLRAEGDTILVAGRIRPSGASGLRPAAILAPAPAAAPTFLAVPESVTVEVGQPVRLEARLAAGGATPTWQWYEGESGDRAKPVAGANAPTLEFTPAGRGAKAYWLEATVDGTKVATPTVYVTASNGLAGFLADAGLPPGTPANADPDGDGVSVLQEFVFGRTGDMPPAAPPSLVQIPETGQQVIVLEFPRRRGATGVTYVVEVSTNLVDWTTVEEIVIRDSGGDLDAALTRAAVPIRANFPGSYVRVRAVLPPGG